MNRGFWIRDKLAASGIRLPQGEERLVWLVCFGISLVFWLFVKLDHTYTTRIQARISWQLPDSLAWYSLPPTEMAVEISGEGWDLLAQEMWRSDPVLFFPVGSRSQQTISRAEIIAQLESQLHPAVDIVWLQLDYIPLHIERRLVRRLPVQVQIQRLTLAKGYAIVDSIRAIPDTVTVSGPLSLVHKLTACPTEPIVAENVEGPLEREVALQLPQPQLLSVQPERVRVRIPAERFTEKTLLQPVAILGDTARIHIQPQRVQLVFELPVSLYSEVDTSDFLLVADLRQLAGERRLTTVPLHLMKSPPLVRNVRFIPPAVSFYVVQPQ